jgi:predicted MFS family arabinose efflux permease
MSLDSSRMSAQELRASLGLAGVGGLRMLGMFIILPVFALYAQQLPGGGSQALIGIALGAYGLTQSLLQFPFGWLSDHWGRKRTLYLGLVLFALGSFIAAMASDIYLIILGRVVQGAGAVSAAVIALAADLTRDQQRTKAMAIIGMTIGATFALSLVAGPILGRLVGVPGIFALTGVLALSALAVVRWVVPDPQSAPSRSAPRPGVLTLLRNPELLRLNLGIFVLHAVLMALFVVVPFALRAAGLAPAHHWEVYLPVMVASVVLMLPVMLAAERQGKQKLAFLGAVGVLLVAQAILAATQDSLPGLVLGLIAFFAAFNLLEASLPSMISRAAPPGQKGAAAGIFTSLQFFGAFAGASAGGAVSQFFGGSAVFVLCGLLTLSWLVVAWPMSAPAAVGVRT